MDEIGAPIQRLANFRLFYIFTQIVGITSIILMMSWIGTYLNGYAWTSQPSVQFNWHPLLMTIGMIFLYGNCKKFYRLTQV
jgi:cytochrome b-561